MYILEFNCRLVEMDRHQQTISVHDICDGLRYVRRLRD